MYDLLLKNLMKRIKHNPKARTSGGMLIRVNSDGTTTTTYY